MEDGARQGQRRVVEGGREGGGGGGAPLPRSRREQHEQRKGRTAVRSNREKPVIQFDG